MIGGLTTRPVAKSTGPGTSMPMPCTSPGRGRRRQQLGEQALDHVARIASGPSVTSARVSRSAREDLPAQVAQGGAHAGGADVGHQQHARVAVEREAAGGTAAASAPPSAAGMSSPAASSASRRWLTVARDRPVCSHDVGAGERSRMVAEQARACSPSAGPRRGRQPMDQPTCIGDAVQ